MDLKGSLISTHLRIYPSDKCTSFLKTLDGEENIPVNLLKFIGKNCKGNLNEDNAQPNTVQLSDEDLTNIRTISDYVKANAAPSKVDKIPVDANKDDKVEEKTSRNEKEKSGDTPEKHVTKEKTSDTKKSKKKDNCDTNNSEKNSDAEYSTEKKETDTEGLTEDKVPEKDLGPHLSTSDIDWLYSYLQKRRIKDKDVPYLHVLLEGAHVELPENKVIKRNPELEARCVKLRAQEEARAYRKMTKGVDNVRMRFPEDSIAYQMKQLNRHLIAIGQFILSIFAGFMFGFKGIEWTIGPLDFGFRLLLGVMIALIIALAEIYFLAKKLNEELNVPATVQLGGPVKFVDEHKYRHLPSKPLGKEHQD